MPPADRGHSRIRKGAAPSLRTGSWLGVGRDLVGRSPEEGVKLFCFSDLYKWLMWVIVCSILVFNCLLALLVVHFRKRRKSAADDLTRSLREVAGYEIPAACSSLEKSYETSAVFLKLKDIVRTLSRVETDECLTVEEWEELLHKIDVSCYHMLSYLRDTFQLSPEEIKICALYLVRIPVKHIGHFVNGYARSTIQLKARELAMRMGHSKNLLLKEVLFSLKEDLKNAQSGISG